MEDQVGMYASTCEIAAHTGCQSNNLTASERLFHVSTEFSICFSHRGKTEYGGLREFWRILVCVFQPAAQSPIQLVAPSMVPVAKSKCRVQEYM